MILYYSFAEDRWILAVIFYDLLGFAMSSFTHIHFGLLYWHLGNDTIASAPVKQPCIVWVIKSQESICN